MTCSIQGHCIGCGACSRVCPVQAVKPVTVSSLDRHSFSISRDACIHCCSCGRVCPVGAVIDGFGRSVRRLPRSEWPKPSINQDMCESCTSCAENCPARALEMREVQTVPGQRGFAYVPILLDDQCVGCGWCERYCQFGAISMVQRAWVYQSGEEAAL